MAKISATVKKRVSDLGYKVGGAATALALPGGLIGQASEAAIQHPYGAGIVGGAIGAGVGVAGALIHQRGVAVGRSQHMRDAADSARR